MYLKLVLVSPFEGMFLILQMEYSNVVAKILCLCWALFKKL